MVARRTYTDEERAWIVEQARTGAAPDSEGLVRLVSERFGEPFRRAQIDSILAKAGITIDEMRRAYWSRGESKPAVQNLDQAPPLVKEPAPLDWTGARPHTTGTGLERRLVLGDLHIPFHDLRACAAVLALARAVQPHVVLILGDFWNMGAVSHHPPPPTGPENHSRAMVMGRAYLDALHRSVPAAEIVLLVGNHDLWCEEFEQRNPQFAGSLAPAIPDFVRVISRRAQPYVRGPVAYLHGYGGGEMSAKKYAIEVAPHAGVKYVKAAHHHTLQCHQTRGGCEGWIVGWLGRPAESAFDYAKNRDHWRTAVVVEDVLGSHVTTTPVRIEGGACLYGGRLVAA